MNSKAFGFFTLVGNLLTVLVGQLPGQEAPRPRVARELVRLFDAISAMREGLMEVSRWIQKCQTAETREGRVYFVFEAGKVLDRLGDACAKLLPWKGNIPQVFDALMLVAPEMEETLKWIEADEVSFREIVVEERLDRSRRAFQAVPQPDPERLPGPGRLQELQDRLQSLSAQCAEALETIRGFATAELRVEDFF